MESIEERAQKMALFFSTLRRNGVPKANAEYLTSREFQDKTWSIGPDIHLHTGEGDANAAAEEFAERFAHEFKIGNGT